MNLAIPWYPRLIVHGDSSNRKPPDLEPDYILAYCPFLTRTSETGASFARKARAGSSTLPRQDSRVSCRPKASFPHPSYEQ